MHSIVCLVFVLFLLPYGAFAAEAADANKVFTETEAFFSWLENHQQKFASCQLKKESNQTQLCDQTAIDLLEIRKMLSIDIPELVKTIQQKGITLKVLCDSDTQGPFLPYCEKNFDEKLFKKTTSLHGQYLPETKTILIRGSASQGSLVHEYIHYLQAENTHPIFGKVYKQSRLQLQSRLTQLMDEKITVIGALEKAGNKKDIQPHLDVFLKSVGFMQRFGVWQDLIDERSIFLLYLRFEKELNLKSEDLALAQKNMQFICQRKELQNQLPSEQCSLPKK